MEPSKEDNIAVVVAPAERRALTRQAARTIGEAFASDPYHQIFQIPPSRRAKFFEALSTLVMMQYWNVPCLYAAANGDAVAVVTRSDSQPVKRRWDVYLSGLWWQMFRLPQESRDALHRWFEGIGNSSQVLKDRGIITPYIKIMFVATHPTRGRGRGLGSKLLSQITAEADRIGLPLFLEASDTGVASLYQRHGFVTVDTLVVRGPREPSQVTLPLMLRMPGASAVGAAAGKGGAGAAAVDMAAGGPTAGTATAVAAATLAE